MIALTIVILLASPQYFLQEPEHVKKDPTMKAHQTTKNPGVTLETTATIENGRLKIEYEVRNTGKSAIYLFNKLYTHVEAKEGWHVDPDRVYIFFGKGRGSLGKRIIPVPRGIAVVAPEIPLATKVDSGKSFREAVSLSLPLKTCDPYDIPRNRGIVVSEVPFTWEIGYFWEKPGSAELERKARTTVGPAIRCPSFDPDNQTILKTEPFSFHVPFAVEEGRKEEKMYR